MPKKEKPKPIAAQQKRLSAEKKRSTKLEALRKEQAKALHAAQKKAHDLEVQRSKISEAKDKRVRSKEKLRERKAERSLIDRALRKVLSEVKKAIREVTSTDSKLTKAKSVIAEITNRPVRERRVAGRRYRADDAQKFFVGGRRDDDVEQGADYAFRVADLMRSRAVVTDKRYDLPKRHKKGGKKGQLQFRQRGGLLDRNLAIFGKIAGKEVDVTTTGTVYVEGKAHRYRRTRRIRAMTYDDIIRTMTDTVRSLFKEYGSLVTYTISEVSYSLPSRKREGRKSQKDSRGASKRKGRVSSVKSAKQVKGGRTKNVGNRAKR